MEKKIIILGLILLTGCENSKVIACSYELEDKAVYLDIDAINDDIVSIHEKTCFVLPNSVLADEEKYNFIVSQLDGSYHFEDNRLVLENDLLLDDTYSLSKTLEDLKTKRFICE